MSVDLFSLGFHPITSHKQAEKKTRPLPGPYKGTTLL